MLEESPVEKEAIPAETTTRPKSRKELRLEKKASKLAERKELAMASLGRKEKRKLQEREERRQLRKEAKVAAETAQEERILRQKELDKEKQEAESTTTGKKRSRSVTQPVQSKKKKKKKKKKHSEEELVKMENVYETLFSGHDETTGFSFGELGVQFKDIIVGKGPPVQENAVCQVKYILTAYKMMGNMKTKVVLDQSSSFRFRLGRGEVIQGWDIGMKGMQVGGRRQLIIPPKAGYGSSDIGAGPGAMLYFNVTLVSF